MAEKWVIADTNEAELIDFPTGSIETSVNDVYISGTINGVAHDNLHTSGSKTFIKYEGSQPSIVSDLITKSEILVRFPFEDWISEIMDFSEIGFPKFSKRSDS